MVGVAVLVALPRAARADITVVECDTYQPFNDAPAFSPGSNDSSTQAYDTCLPSGGLGIWSKGARSGFGAWWFANVPSGWLTIAEAKAWFSTSSPCPFDGVSAEFAWNDYGQNAGTSPMCGRAYIDQTFSSPVSSFGWRVWCANSTTCDIPGSTPTIAYVQGVWLDVREGATPSLTAVGGGPSGSQNLWFHGGGWVRGPNWDLDLAGGDITGVCRFFAAIDGNWVAGGQWEWPNQAGWHQCDAGDTGGSDQYGDHQQRWSATIDTNNYSDGWHTYQVGDQNAAGNWGANPSAQIGIDNAAVSLALGGPTDAPTTGPTPTITATASAGASGVGAIYCQQNGGTWTSEPLSGGGTQTATADIPVDQVGTNVIRCQASNGAVDVNNNPATSPIQTWTLHIGEPVVAHISFAKLRLSCRWVRERKHHRTKQIRRCSVITHDRRVERVRYGKRVTVSGSLATAAHAALAGVPVRVIAAVDNGENHWRTVVAVRTDASGRWQTTLRPGPSREIAAVYDGGLFTEAATSGQARTVVPAKVVLARLPTRVPWGGVLVIRGRVLGGYIPGNPPEKILQLQSGAGKHLQVIGNPSIRRDGRFVIRIAATGSGAPIRTQIAVATLHETNYPYVPGVSRTAGITIG